jgi:predicted ATPase
VITSVHIWDVQVLRRLDIDLEPFTVFVGPNACGKTTLLRALARLSGQFLADAKRPEREWAPSQPFVWAVSDVLMDRDAVLIGFEPSALRSPAEAGGGSVIAPDGRGLGRVLADAILASPSNRSLITERVAAIVPGVRDVRAERYSGSSSWVPVVVFDHLGPVMAAGLSEGTLYAIGLAVVLSTTGPGALVLIDDLDKGLHPAAQAEVVNVLRKAQAADPTLQIVATTHSPYLLGSFEHREVRVMTRGPDGTAVCRKLTEHPDFEKWKDALDAGDMWASVGEDWIVEPHEPA